MTEIDWLGESNLLGLDIWRNKYKNKDETFDEWLDRVSNKDKDLRNLIKEKRFLFGGRALSNRGLNNGSLFNCYSAGFCEDDFASIMETNKILGLTYKAQGGQGVSMSKLRPKGVKIKDRYDSDGIIPFMELFNTTTEITAQAGCIYEEEYVQTSSGLKKIKNIKINDLVWTKVGWVPVDFVYDKGIQEIYEVTTDKGYKIRTTIDHKFCTDGFNKTSLDKLSVGDKVCLISNDVSEEVIEFDSLYYIIGLIYGNGYINYDDNVGAITFNYKDKENALNVIKMINELGYESKITEEKKGSFVRILLNAKFVKYLTSIGIIKKKCYEIEIPDMVMEANVSKKVSFVSGAIDSDGTARKHAFKYSSVSEKYIRQLHIILSSLGYFPSISIYDRDGHKRLFEVIDSFRVNQPRLFSYRINKKNIKQCGNIWAKNSKLSTPYTISNSSLTPKDHNHLGKIGKESEIGLYTYVNSYKNKKDSYKPMVYDKIKSIEKFGSGRTYDLSLEKEHLFYCNGFYVSNSRKGALIISLDIRHKQAEEFIKIKSDANKINKANLSLEIDDEFMEAVRKYYQNGEEIILHEKRNYSDHIVEYDICPIKLYKLMMEYAYDWAEPGCIYSNRFRNYNLMEFDNDYNIETCNPCRQYCKA